MAFLKAKGTPLGYCPQFFFYHISGQIVCGSLMFNVHVELNIISSGGIGI